MLRAPARYAAVVFLVAIFPAFAFAQADSTSLVFETQSPQPIPVGETFTLPLVVHGGFLPYTWALVDGHLPPGLRLQHHKGAITGAPTVPGEYHFKLSVTDSNIPHQEVARDFSIVVTAGLTLDWKQPPKVQDSAITGSAVLTNTTAHPLDVTLIIVAVNQIGRATALGYQHFTLAAQAASPVIPFGSSPGPGTYTVRADAAAHRKNGHHIFRVSKTADTLQVTSF